MSADVNNYRPIAIATALSKVLEQLLLPQLVRYLWTADSQFGFKQAHGTEMAIFALKQMEDFYSNQDTPVYICFLDAKKASDRVNHWMLTKKLLDRNMPVHIVKLFIFWYIGQVFMVQWGNSLSMTFCCLNGIRQGDSYPHCCIMYCKQRWPKPSPPSNRCMCYVGGAWVNLLSYVDDMVLLAPTVTAHQTLMEVCCTYAGPHDTVYNIT